MIAIGAGRGLTNVAIGFLIVDAVLLAYAGIAMQRPALLIGALLLMLLASGVAVLWRRQRARLEEIGAARAALKAEVNDLRSLVRASREAPKPSAQDHRLT